MSINYRVLRVLSVMVLGVFLLFSTAVYAETIYLKDGTIIRGAVKSEDEKTILIEMGDTWKRVDKSNIESMNKDTVRPENTLDKTVPAEKQAETKVQAQQSNEATSRTVTDLRLKFGSAAQADKVSAQGSTLAVSGTDSGNVQVDVNTGFYGNSNVGLVLSAGIFSRTHSGKDNDPSFPTTVDYEARGLSLGAGIGIKTSDHLHFEGKVELGMGTGNVTLSTPGFIWNETEAGGYGSVSIILGAYYTMSRPGLQIGLELGTQSFSGDFRIRTNMGGWVDSTVEGSSSTANLVVGMRF